MYLRVLVKEAERYSYAVNKCFMFQYCLVLHTEK